MLEGWFAFLQAAFDAEGEVVGGRPSQLKIGDSMLMVSDGGGIRPAMPAFLHLYVPDVDASHARALAAGVHSIEPPTVMPWGDRRATISDDWGKPLADRYSSDFGEQGLMGCVGCQRTIRPVQS